MIDLGSGLNGFIGSKLKARLPDIGEIAHDRIETLPHIYCDRFFFLSTYGNMAHHDNIGAMFRANVMDVDHVLTSLNPKLFIYLSSSSVTLPVQTPYSLCKCSAEHIIRTATKFHCIIRPYSVTGVGEQKEHLIPRLIDSCMKGTKMDFVPDATHDYVDVEDVVDGILFLVNNGYKGTFEIGKGIAWTNQQVLGFVEDACGKKANVNVVRSMRAYDNNDWRCKSKIDGWMPRKSLVETISEMVEAYNAQ